MAWQLDGEYLENCNCKVLCPCITSSLQGPADQERCLVPLAMHIERGELDGTSLDGLNAILVCDTPQVMGEGGWRVALYLDERASEEQRDALGQILSGRVGGPPAMLSGLLGEFLGTKVVPIEWEADGDHRRVAVPGIMEFAVEGIRAPGGERVMEIVGVAHPMGSDLAIARSTRGVYDDADYGLSFDNSGKNGHYRAFSWAG